MMSDTLERNRILILTTSYPSWLEQRKNTLPSGKFVHDMAKAFVAGGDDIYVLTHHADDTPDFQCIDGVWIYRFHYFIPRWETLTKGSGMPENIRKMKNKPLAPLYFLCLFWKAIHLIRQKKINVVNAHWAVPAGYIALWLKHLTGIKLITTVYGAELFPVIEGHMKLLKPFTRKAIEKADEVVGISQTTVDAARVLSGRTTIHLIPDGIDIAYYHPGDGGNSALEKYNCQDRRTIFFTGRVVERKGHIHLLAAMRYVHEACPDVKLILGGKGPMWHALQSMRAELQLEDIVELPGFIPEVDIVPLLQAVDLYVLPSCIDRNGDTEGSATAALEAMSCATVALVSRVGGNIGAVEEGEGAYYFAPSDPEDLARKIVYFFMHDHGDESLTAKARAFVVQNYDWSSTIRKYKQIINSAI